MTWRGAVNDRVEIVRISPRLPSLTFPELGAQKTVGYLGSLGCHS